MRRRSDNPRDPSARRRAPPRRRLRRALGWGAVLLGLGASPDGSSAADIPAFPGAEGFGATTPGGRGGRVLLVTNLEDAGPGSLRAACEAEGPRIVVFRVGGLITLERDITISNPYLTLAGQSAPGDGVCLRGAPLKVATHDVIVRHLRSRLGDEQGAAADCLDLDHGARRVVLDHCSASWSVDEVLSLAGDVAEVTIQWCLIAEALHDSIHNKGPHGMGTLARANGPVTFHHNLWAHHNSRNPRMGSNYDRPPFPRFDVRQNVIYNYGETCTGMTQGDFPVNYVGNYIRPGPSSTSTTPISVGGPSDLLFYITGNVFDGDAPRTRDNTRFFSRTRQDGQTLVTLVDAPFPAPHVTAQTGEEVLDVVLASVGATRPTRDAVDARIIREVRSRSGRIINSQTEVGGWPAYRSAPPPPDTDRDGMPDAWESARRLDPENPADAAHDRNGDGYSNVEEYLNALAAEIPSSRPSPAAP